jgi:hypothetical protein
LLSSTAAPGGLGFQSQSINFLIRLMCLLSSFHL